MIENDKPLPKEVLDRAEELQAKIDAGEIRIPQDGERLQDPGVGPTEAEHLRLLLHQMIIHLEKQMELSCGPAKAYAHGAIHAYENILKHPLLISSVEATT